MDAAVPDLDQWLAEVEEGSTDGLIGVFVSVTRARMLRKCVQNAILRPVNTYMD